MAAWNSIAIVGVGLIGGSIGLAARERGVARRVIGIGRDADRLAVARRRDAASDVTTDLAFGVAEAELTIVCTPVGRIAEDVRRVTAHCPPGALVTDAGSTKATIVRAVGESLPRGVSFVGSHPMAGSEKTGVESARADLFEGRVVVVTPTASTPASVFERIVDFWRSLGARVERLSPEEHDSEVAAISHLPHLVAAALAAATPRAALRLAAGGWEDTTRVAAGDVELWRQILTENREPLLRSLDPFVDWVARFRSALETGNDRELATLLRAGKELRDALGN